MEKREQVILTVDVLVKVAPRNFSPLLASVVFVQRGKEPFLGSLVLPGGHVEAGETATQAAVRELREETGLKVPESHLKFEMVLDKPGRDPRPGRRVSVVYSVEVGLEQATEELKAGSDANGIVVCDRHLLKRANIGFDHWEAVAKIMCLDKSRK